MGLTARQKAEFRVVVSGFRGRLAADSSMPERGSPMVTRAGNPKDAPTRVVSEVGYFLARCQSRGGDPGILYGALIITNTILVAP